MSRSDAKQAKPKSHRLMCCTSSNVICLISCKICKEQYVGHAFQDNFKPRYRVHKTDVIIDKDRLVWPNIF